MIKKKYSLSGLFLSLLCIAMILRFHAFGIPATVFPYVLGGMFSAIYLIAFGGRFHGYMIFSAFFSWFFFHASATNFNLIGAGKVSALALIFFASYRAASLVVDAKKIINYLVYVNLLFLLMELFLRVSYGENFIKEGVSLKEFSELNEFFLGGFYRYKLGSPFFYDSNFAGIHALILFIFVQQFRDFLKWGSFCLWLVGAIVIASLSRSCILVLFAYLIYISLRDSSVLLKVFMGTGMVLCFALVSIMFISGDWSFRTKLDVWVNLLSYNFSGFSLVFGEGYGGGKFLFGFSEGSTSHSLIPTLIGEFGLIGLLVFQWVLFIISGAFGVSRWMTFFVINIAGFALFDPLEPMLFFLSAISAAFVKRSTRAASYRGGADRAALNKVRVEKLEGLSQGVSK